MHGKYIVIKEIYKFRKKYLSLLLAAGIFFLVLAAGGCAEEKQAGTDQEFETFTNALFCQETAANTISLHYSLKDPEAYGIEDPPITFGTFAVDDTQAAAALENTRKALDQFEQRELSVQNQITYDILAY